MPGGFNALSRIYREVQEPMMNATRDQFSQNPFSALLNNANSSAENRNIFGVLKKYFFYNIF